MTNDQDHEDRSPVAGESNHSASAEKLTDSRHNPEAALLAIKATLSGGGTPETGAAVEDLRRRGLVLRLPDEEMVRLKDGTVRYRLTIVKTGIGRAVPFREWLVGSLEQDYGRLLNDQRKRGKLASVSSRGAVASAKTRSMAAARVARRVFELYEQSRQPPRDRAAAIAKRMEKDGRPLSIRRVREILANRRRLR